MQAGLTSLKRLGSTMPKIMVVDDEATVLFLIKVLLERAKMEVTGACGGLEAYETLTAPGAGAARPDLIILDAMMPGMDGYAFMAKLRDGEGLDKIPVIILSGKDNHSKENFALSENIYAVLQKPFEPGNLLKVAKEALAAGKPDGPV